MDDKNIKIVVSGDICINLLQWKTNSCVGNLNWQSYPYVHSDLKPGEALLLSKLIASATNLPIISPEIDYSNRLFPEEMLHSTSELGLFSVSGNKSDKDKVYRIKNFLGYSGPCSEIPKLLPIVNDDENADLVILDDEDNGFNSSEEFWPLALKSPNKKPVVIYKMNNPIGSNSLWKHLEEFHIENTIVVINADDLRSKGVNISRSLSWERTALDFIWQLNNNPSLSFLAKCHHLIVPFGLEGAIHYRNDGTSESRLYFLTNEFEGDFIKDSQGSMYGLLSCFTAGLAHNIVFGILNDENLNESISEGIREGIVYSQKYFIHGFGKNPEAEVCPNSDIFAEGENDFIYKEQIQDVVIRNSNNPNCRACWYIIKDKSSINLAEIAYDIVKNGEESALKFIPIARFGNLKTVDRTEIESYRSIKNLMLEYISTKNTVRPLSIAVFGTPGSGKSFGVTEVASSIAPGLIKKINFNLSQLQTLEDLNNAFHKVRDLSLEGKLPLVFFDEFDSSFATKLGWLKYFLAPMQDGVFREGDSIHPIGKAIFVFAGGTSSTFEQFCGEEIEDEKEQKYFMREFQSAKGPDFISRLRGYVNILGPNQTDENWDQLFIVRRAMLLRSLIERKVPHLINGKGEAQIDNGVLRAMLKVARYKHESRSMEAIMEMSMLTNAKKWEQSYLPSKEQLKLHVDEEQFSRHLMQDAFFSEKIETLAMNTYQKHEMLKADNDHKVPSKLWNNIDDDIRNTSIDQIKHIPDALHRINYDIVSVKEKASVIKFTVKELNTLGAYEHKRWCLQKKEAGWVYGKEKNSNSKTHPSLVAWEILPEDRKRRVIDTVKFWPEILADANFKIEKLKSLCYCEVHGLLD
ncbi:RyR domain-containing protein [Clostridium pasteurianum]|uniref:RyR domain protein n=1 Tax=Clostridium pasteurianum BC1 TaxID=86416 RepID=R4KCZ8_CLOPA|nr:RyR domain-containing protein [Clostridium pasteurianum]AGK98424.1 RyR domain protein [Clostridium pasteurianum BC1]